ncbi:DUF6597 domain-containing transcriptional factor [Mucilaginibacter sp. HD30]
MEHKELDVSAALGHSIREFWYLEKDFGRSPSVFEVLPDGHAEIIFHFGSGCSLVLDDRIESLPSPFIVGLLGKPVFFSGTGPLTRNRDQVFSVGSL